MRKRKKNLCTECGEPIFNKFKNSIYCKDCAKNVRIERQKKYTKKFMEKYHLKKEKEKKLNIQNKAKTCIYFTKGDIDFCSLFCHFFKTPELLEHHCFECAYYEKRKINQKI